MCLVVVVPGTCSPGGLPSKGGRVDTLHALWTLTRPNWVTWVRGQLRVVRLVRG
jgi:hypothetical protein